MSPRLFTESTETRIEKVSNRVLTIIVAMVLIAMGAAVVLVDVRYIKPPSIALILVGIAIAVFGGFLIVPTPMFSVLTQWRMQLHETNLPFVGGGRRATDNPQVPPANPPSQP